MSSLTLRPTAPCRRQHDLLLDPSSGNGAPSRWQKTGDKSAHLNQASPLKSANLLHKHVAASPALSVTRAPSTGCYLQTRSCPAPRNEHQKKRVGSVRNRACALSKYNKASVLCCAVRVFQRRAQHNRVCNCFSALWLPSLCWSPFSGRCGKTKGLRFCAGSPCQLAVVTTMGGEMWSEGLQVS